MDLGNLIGDKAQCGGFRQLQDQALRPRRVGATVPFAEGIRESVQWFEKHPERCTIDDAFNALSDRILRAQDGALRSARG